MADTRAVQVVVGTGPAGSGLTFGDAGEYELRRVPDRWHLYRVMSERA